MFHFHQTHLVFFCKCVSLKLEFKVLQVQEYLRYFFIQEIPSRLILFSYQVFSPIEYPYLRVVLLINFVINFLLFLLLLCYSLLECVFPLLFKDNGGGEGMRGKERERKRQKHRCDTLTWIGGLPHAPATLTRALLLLLKNSASLNQGQITVVYLKYYANATFFFSIWKKKLFSPSGN